MQDSIRTASEKITGKWNSLSGTTKIVAGTTVGALVIGAGIGAYTFLSPDMEVLYRGLDLKDASAITQVLDTEKIEYNVIDSGTAIELNSKDLNTAKLALARENIPKSGYTFDDAITNSMSTTEDEKRAKMTEYKKAEIEKALESMNNIREAKITLDIPKDKNYFMSSKESATASVMLTLTDKLDSKQVNGIARFIASSVENLDVNNITIIDTEGNNLFIGEDEESFAIGKQQELKSSAEKAITKKVNDLISPLFDNVTVSTNLVLDFNQLEEVREEYEPQFDGDGKGIIKNESTTSQSSTNGTTGGEPGTTPNTGQATNYATSSTSNSESKSSSKDTEYVNNKIVSSSVKNVGDIDYKKSSVAVNVFKFNVFEEEEIEKTLGDKTWEEFKKENSNKIPMEIDSSLIEQIKVGTGIDNVVLNGYEKPVFIDKEPFVVDYKSYVPYLGLLFGLLGLVLYRFSRKPKVKIETEPELDIESMLTVSSDKAIDNKEVDELEEIELKEILETKKRIEQFVDDKPEAVAQLLRTWLMEEEELN